MRAAFSPDSRRIITCSRDGTARVWETETAQPVSKDLLHGGAVTCAVFSPSGEMVVTASLDRTMRFCASGASFPPACSNSGKTTPGTLPLPRAACSCWQRLELTYRSGTSPPTKRWAQGWTDSPACGSDRGSISMSGADLASGSDSDLESEQLRSEPRPTPGKRSNWAVPALCRTSPGQNRRPCAGAPA